MTTQLAKQYVLTLVRAELETLFERFDEFFDRSPKDQQRFLEEIHAALKQRLDEIDSDPRLGTS